MEVHKGVQVPVQESVQRRPQAPVLLVVHGALLDMNALRCAALCCAWLAQVRDTVQGRVGADVRHPLCRQHAARRGHL